MSLPGYDAWATGGRYVKSLILVHCEECDQATPVVAETEYGAETWTPDECRHCGATFPDDAEWVDDEPPEPDHRQEGLYD